MMANHPAQGALHLLYFLQVTTAIRCIRRSRTPRNLLRDLMRQSMQVLCTIATYSALAGTRTGKDPGEKRKPVQGNTVSGTRRRAKRLWLCCKYFPGWKKGNQVDRIWAYHYGSYPWATGRTRKAVPNSMSWRRISYNMPCFELGLI